MKISSRYSKSFYSDRLSDTKYQEIYAFAVHLNQVKNEISKQVNSNLLFYLDMSKFDFQKCLLPQIRHKVRSNFSNQLLDDVYISYQNKFKGISKKLRFEQIYDYQFSYYKRKVKTHNKGDFKGNFRTDTETGSCICADFKSCFNKVSQCPFYSDVTIDKSDFSDCIEMFMIAGKILEE